jgi:hypothetical protein
MRSIWVFLAAFSLIAVTVCADFTPSKGPSGGPPGALPSGPTKFIVLSEKKGVEKFHVNQTKYVTIFNMPEKVERKATAYSPLAYFVPEKFIPIVASAIGAFLISLVHQFISLGQSYVENVISNRKRQKMKIKDEAVRVVGIKVREVFSVTAAAFILGAAISWTFAGPSSDFIWLMGLNVIICLVAGISHEGVHRVVGKILGIKSEYVFWFSGSLMTIVTAILGNAFGLQGFLLDEAEEGTPHWKMGLMKISAPLFSLAMLVLFGVANIINPNVIFQMICSISGMMAMADIIPFKPMDGYDVRKWNFFVWLGAFVLIGTTFTMVSFTF